ncbi:MAG TPA: trypsin-like peptidase domain-containing protein [Candidatus Sulfotelmatobacter sp.]|nr:trypsin-like peptidase domain-containing protein [Candidatus Sulfotelmatobacter sp.]
MHRVDLVFNLRFVLLPRVKLSVGPLFIARSLENRFGRIVANGSFGLINTGKRKLLVTCQHVVEGFKNELTKDNELKLWACLADRHAVVIELKSLVDEDAQRDLATFDVEPMLSEFNGREFFQLICGAVRTVRKGDTLFVTGYPCRNRNETDEAILWGTSPHSFIAKDVSDTSIIAVTSRIMSLERKLLSKETDNPYGGLSGSPCFWTRDFVSIELVAFVSEHLNTMEIMKFTLAKFINSDGTIAR